MELNAAIQLIQNDQLSAQTPATWADLGCGSGLFTFALAHFLQPGSIIHAIDKDPVRLPAFPSNRVEIKTLQLDFVTKKLPFQPLDGILMANSLHYVQDKTALISQLSEYLQPDGQFLIVEYDTDTPVPQWVPYPIPFRSLQRLFAAAEYSSIEHLGEHPSVYGRANMYAALISR